METDVLVLVGRFAPFRRVDAARVRAALAKARVVVVALGSAGEARSTLHPWTVDERSRMIALALGDDAGRVRFAPVRDSLYAEARWVADVQRAVHDALAVDGSDGHTGVRIGLVASPCTHARDGSSRFPQWLEVELPDVPTAPARALVHAALCGDDERTSEADSLLDAELEPVIRSYLRDFRSLPSFTSLQDERRRLDEYREAWSGAPYAPIFVTADAVIVHSGHVLLIRRKGVPGRGLDALPGGFVDGDEPVLDACLRELQEETGIELSDAALRGALRGSRVFDHPERSARRRTITHGFYFEFDGGPLPKVRCGDDAEAARFVPLSEVPSMQGRFFEDHLHILETFVGRL